jgi:hypothetical protein
MMAIVLGSKTEAPAMWTAQVVLSLLALGQETAKDASLESLQRRVAKTRVALASAKESTTVASLVSKPVFRYSDELREIEDAGIWLWADRERPIAALKIERYKPGRFKVPWLYCFASLATSPLRAEWEDADPFVSRKAGLTWQGIDEKVLASRPARLVQMREMARQFSAEILADAEGRKRTQMRVLPQPLYRSQESTTVHDGAVFGFTGTGTNPDLLLLLDLPVGGSWRFAAAGMTAEGLQMQHNDRTVFSSPYTVDKGNIFDTWCNFHPAK